MVKKVVVAQHLIHNTVNLYITTTQWAKQIWSLKTGGRRRQGGTDRNRELKIDSVVGIHDSSHIDGCKVLMVEPKHE